MSKIIGRCLLVVMTSLAVPTVEAQTQTRAVGAQAARSTEAPLRTAARVRVTTSHERVIGSVVAQDADSLQLRMETGTVRFIPVSELRRVEVSDGVRTTRGRSSAFGFLAGALIGGVVAYATYTEPTRTCGPDTLFCGGFGLDQSAAALQGVAVGGVLGGAVGFLLGSRRQERWTTSGIAIGTGRLDVAPTGRSSLAIAGSLRF